MTRRTVLFALTAAAVCLALGLTFARGIAAPKSDPAAPQAKAKDYASMPPAVRLLTAEADGPRAPGAAEAIQGLLNADKPALRAEAAQALGTWAASADSARILALSALSSPDPLVRGMAQAAYLEDSPFGVVPLVVQGTIIGVAPPVAEALAELGDPHGFVRPEKLIPAVEAALKQDLDGPPESAVLAADLLARTGDAGARRMLITLIQTGDGLVLAKAARACVRDEMGLGPTMLPTAFKGGAVARQAVMRALVARPEPRLKSLLVQGLSDRDVSVRHNAIRAIGNLGAAAPVEELAAKLAGPPAEAYDAAVSLGNLGAPGTESLRRFILAGKGPDELQVAAILAIAPQTGRDDIAWLSERAKSPNRSLRAAAATALGRTGNPAALAALMAAAKDEEPLVRATAAKGLGQIGTPAGTQQLVTMLDDASPLVVSMAAAGLGQASSRDTIPALARVARLLPPADAAPARLSEVHGWPTLAAIESLGRIGGPEAATVLGSLLESKSWLVRAAAAGALGPAGDSSAPTIEAVEKRLQDPVGLVRAEALVSLKALGKTYPAGQVPGR